MRATPGARESLLIQEGHGLNARDIEALAATHVLAHHDVVLADHVGTGLGEAGTVALVGAGRKTLFLSADQPADLVLAGLVTVRAAEIGGLPVGSLVKKFALVHKRSLVAGRWPDRLWELLHTSSAGKQPAGCRRWLPSYTAAGTGMPRKKKIKRFRAVIAVKEMAREQIGTPPPTQVLPDRKKRKPEKHKPTLGKLLDED